MKAAAGSIRLCAAHGAQMSAAQEAKVWFVLLEQKQRGPFTFTNLVQAAESGWLDLGDHVCRLDWTEWRLARDVHGLFTGKPESEVAESAQDTDFEDAPGRDDQLMEDRGKDVRAAAKKATADVFTPSKPTAADKFPYDTATEPRLGLSDPTTEPRSKPPANRSRHLSTSFPQPKSLRVWIVMLSSLSTIAVVLGLSWVAIARGIIRVTFSF
jgi:hypothetical protein